MKWEDNMKTFEELVDEIAQVLPNPIDGFVEKGLEREVAKSLAEVVGLKEFLKATLSADMRRYFAASPVEQERIKGSFARTVYLLGLARTGKELESMVGPLEGKRKNIGELHNI